MTQNKMIWMTALLLLLPGVMAIPGLLSVERSVATAEGSWYTDAFTGSQIATQQNSLVASIGQFYLDNETSLEHRVLSPRDQEDITVSAGLLYISWDDLRNAIDNRSLADIENLTISQRGFFLTINGNTTAIDPLNNSQCRTDDEAGVYHCVFFLDLDQRNATGGVYHETTISGSSVNHDREFNVVTIVPKRAGLTTGDDIVTWYFTQSKILLSMGIDIATGVYYFVLIGMALGGIILIIVVLKKVYTTISSGGKE